MGRERLQREVDRAWFSMCRLANQEVGKRDVLWEAAK